MTAFGRSSLFVMTALGARTTVSEARERLRRGATLALLGRVLSVGVQGSRGHFGSVGRVGVGMG